MQRQIAAAAAIVLGAVGFVPMLLRLAWVLFGLGLEDLAVQPVWIINEALGPLWSPIFFIFAPCLLLWGLIEIQRTERGRWRVRFWALLLCACGAPFGIGIILCLPVFLCVILPIMRRFRSAGDTPRAEPSA